MVHRQNIAKINRYKKAIDECCNPECKFGYGLQVHHILPVSQGGLDDFRNYIVLCAECHPGKENHQPSILQRIKLRTYKFYFERLKLGFSSGDLSDEEFGKILQTHENAPESPTVEKLQNQAPTTKRIRKPIRVRVGDFLDKTNGRYQVIYPYIRKWGQISIISEIS